MQLTKLFLFKNIKSKYLNTKDFKLRKFENSIVITIVSNLQPEFCTYGKNNFKFYACDIQEMYNNE